MTKDLGILFLGGAKRVSMARMFKAAAQARGYQARIIGYELNGRCALASEGTIVEGLRWSDPHIIDDLNELCRREDISIAVPFVDPAVGIAARLDVFAPVGDAAGAEKMFDKVAAAELFAQAAISIPRTYVDGTPVGPLIAKPRFGSASKGIVAIDSLQDLYRLNDARHKYLIQERIDHRQEISADCYVGVGSGQINLISARVRSEVSGGEAVRTVTFEDAQVTELVAHVLKATRLRGAVTVQLIRQRDSGRLMVMEVNPRLGGGAVATVHAGADLPGLIIDDCLGRDLTHQHAMPGVETVRYLADIVFYPQ